MNSYAARAVYAISMYSTVPYNIKLYTVLHATFADYSRVQRCIAPPRAATLRPAGSVHW
jgi:hypothetical protein